MKNSGSIYSNRGRVVLKIRDFLSQNKFFFLQICIIVLLFVLQESLLFFKGFYAISADESGRTFEAYKWFTGNNSFFSIWLPFQKIVYGAVFKLYCDLFVLPRLISLAFGLMTLLSTMALSYELFKDKTVSILTGFLGIIFPAFSIFSILPLSEIYFFFFTITSILFYTRWVNNGYYSSLLLSTVFLFFGETVRFETWVFAAIVFLLASIRIFRSDKPKKNKITIITVVFIILSAFPLYWIYLSYYNMHHVFGFIDEVSANYVNNIEGSKDNLLFTFLEINTITLNIIGLISFYLLFKKLSGVRQYTCLFFSTLLLFFLISYKLNAMPDHNFWRIPMIWSIMLIPFTAYFITRLLYNGGKSKAIMITFVILLSVVSYLFISQTLWISSSTYLSESDLKAGRILKGIFKHDKSNAYLERNSSWDYNGVQVLCENPYRIITSLDNYDNYKDTLFYMDDKLVSELKQKNISYMVLRSYTKILPDKVSVLTLAKLKSWSVYKIEY